jgi:hypothetical protein
MFYIIFASLNMHYFRNWEDICLNMLYFRNQQKSQSVDLMKKNHEINLVCWKSQSYQFRETYYEISKI